MSNTSTDKPTDNFTWTDEIVEEFISRDPSIHRCKEDILEFKQSKQPKKEQPKRFEVLNLICKSRRTKDEYFLLTNGEIPEEKYEAVKKAISDCLNEGHPKEKLDNPFFGMGYSFFNHPNSISTTKEQLDAMMENVWNAARDAYRIQIPNTGYKLGDVKFKYENFKDYQQSLPENKQAIEDKEKDWEILSFKHNKSNSQAKLILAEGKEVYYWEGSDINKNPLTLDFTLKSDNLYIFSVRRLSDNTTFTVGDEIVWGEQRYKTKITGFKIHDGIMLVCFNMLIKSIPLCGNYKIEKSETKVTSNASINCQNEAKTVLFTTEDGIDVFIGNTYWMVTALEQCWKADETLMREELKNPPSYFKYFSTKEAAEKWIEWNKPQHSLAEIMAKSTFDGIDGNGGWYKFNVQRFLTKK